MGALKAGGNTTFRLDSPLGIFQQAEKNEEGAETKALPKTRQEPHLAVVIPISSNRPQSVMQALQRTKLRVNIYST